MAKKKVRKIKTYHVYGTVTGGKYLGSVQAKTKNEAEEKAWDELDASVSFCHHCSGQCEDPQILELNIEEDDG